MPIMLNDILRLNENELRRAKIKFNQDNHYENPMEVFLANPETVNNQWLFWRNEQRYFSIGQIAICFVKLSGDFWFLSTIKEVTQEFGITNGINYAGTEIERFSPFFGRLIVKFHKQRTQGYNALNIINSIEVSEILPSVLDGVDFPGYDSVRLTFNQLDVIIQRHKHDWVAALENQKAVYLITDRNTGNLYVGSAYGDNGMLLQRWTNYRNNGHGGNVLLKAIIDENGIDYARNYFQFSILENYNSRTDNRIIRSRESWWKEALGTRAFGLNAN